MLSKNRIPCLGVAFIASVVVVFFVGVFVFLWVRWRLLLKKIFATGIYVVLFVDHTEKNNCRYKYRLFLHPNVRLKK